MRSVCCQVCGTEIALVHPEVVEERIRSGEYVTRRAVSQSQWGGGQNVAYQEGVFGICSKCRREQGQALVKGNSDAQADAQMIRIRDYVAQARRSRPEWTLQQAVTAAIAWEFRPQNEPDRGFRAYLLGEGAPKDAEVDARAHQIMTLIEQAE